MEEIDDKLTFLLRNLDKEFYRFNLPNGQKLP
jgi:hypothetical protein